MGWSGWLARLGLARWWWRRPSSGASFGGRALAPGRLHLGEVSGPEALPGVVSRIEAARLAVVDLDGVARGLAARPGWLVRPPCADGLVPAALGLGLRGAFDAVVVVFEVGARHRGPQGAELLRLIEGLPARPWVALAVGRGARRDPLWQALRAGAWPLERAGSLRPWASLWDDLETGWRTAGSEKVGDAGDPGS